MNILANVLAFGLGFAPGNTLFDQVSVQLDRVPVNQTELSSSATPAVANWVAPNASAVSSATATATPATANWVSPNASASSSATATATPAVSHWTAPDAVASSSGTAAATPASASWIAPAASSTMTLPPEPREIDVVGSASAYSSVLGSATDYSSDPIEGS